jgi:hypothetical protein
MDVPAQQPDTVLTVECRVVDRWGVMGRARVTIRTGRVDCEFPPRFGLQSGTQPITHSASEISVFRARIPVFLMRTTVRLVGDDGRVFYIWPFRRLDAVLDALLQAGFTLRRRSTWLSAAARPWAPGA